MVKIGTHSGSFHCDEALGCWMLRRTAQFKDADIVRSRDPEVLNALEIIIDVGGVYDASSNRFDHHQRGFTEVFGHGFNTKLSSAGLVYKHFGREVVAGILGLSQDDSAVDTVYKHVYKQFIQAVDAIDNGINQYDSTEPPKYVNNTTLSARVGHLNPAWNEPFTDEALYARFLKAVALTGGEFEEAVRYTGTVWLPGRTHALEAIQQRLQTDSSGKVIKLNHFCPWKDHLYELERELQLEGVILYCIYQDDRDHSWRVQCVSKSEGSFENRKSMPAAWRGIRDDELSKVSGIPGCVFVHASGFIGGNKTLEGALDMARKSLHEPEL